MGKIWKLCLINDLGENLKGWRAKVFRKKNPKLFLCNGRLFEDTSAPVHRQPNAAHNVCWLVEKFIVEPPQLQQLKSFSSRLGWFNWFSKYFLHWAPLLCWQNQQLRCRTCQRDTSHHIRYCSKWKMFSVSQLSRAACPLSHWDCWLQRK